MDARLRLDLGLYEPVRAGAPSPDRLVHAHLPLVRRIAWHVHARISSAIEVEELVQAGTLALVEAAQSFIDRGEASFATYATLRIRGAMIDLLRRQSSLSRGMLRRRREIAVARADLERELKRKATEEEVATRVGLTVETVRAAETAMPARQESLDDAYSEHSLWFADDAPSALDSLTRERLQSALAAAIAELPERQALILQLYFVEEMNLEEIGAVLGVGAARVCQIKKTALTALRGQLSGWND